MELVLIIVLAVGAASGVVVGVRRTRLGKQMERSFEGLKVSAPALGHSGSSYVLAMQGPASSQVEVGGHDRATVVPVEDLPQIPRAS